MIKRKITWPGCFVNVLNAGRVQLRTRCELLTNSNDNVQPPGYTVHEKGTSFELTYLDGLFVGRSIPLQLVVPEEEELVKKLFYENFAPVPPEFAETVAKLEKKGPFRLAFWDKNGQTIIVENLSI